MNFDVYDANQGFLLRKDATKAEAMQIWQTYDGEAAIFYKGEDVTNELLTDGSDE